MKRSPESSQNERLHFKDMSPLSRFSDEVSEQQLHEQIHRLMQTISEMEMVRLSEQKEIENRIRALSDAKETAELKLITLEAAAVSQNASGRVTQKQLIRSLEQLQKEKHMLQKRLSEEQILHSENQQKAFALEQQLLKEITDLKRDLGRVKADNENMGRNVTKKYQELNRLLRSAQGKLEEIKKDRDSMILFLIEVTGKEVTNLNKVRKNGPKRK